MIDLLKRIFAVCGIICFLAFVGLTAWGIFKGTLSTDSGPMLIALSAFLGFGLLSIGIRWLQNLKKKELKKQQDAENEKAAESKQ